MLDQDFIAEKPSQKWAGDISYTWTREVWLYLALAVAIGLEPMANKGLLHYIDGFYNPRRRHPALGWKSPVAFERKEDNEQLERHEYATGHSFLPQHCAMISPKWAFRSDKGFHGTSANFFCWKTSHRLWSARIEKVKLK